jgi:hypothetical protein
MKALDYVTPVTLLTLLLLTGCSQGLSPKKSTLNIYQAPVLRVEKGTEIQTLDGLYKVQQDEIWHSDDRYRSLERQLIDQ